MGYYSDVNGTVTIDMDKAIAIVKNSNTSSNSTTADFANNIKNALNGATDTVSDKDMLKQVYDDWARIFLNSEYLHDTFDEFVNNGEISGSVYGLKMYEFSDDLKQFVENYRDAIISLYAERDGEDNEDMERFEVRNVDGKNVLYAGQPVIEFKYTAI